MYFPHMRWFSATSLRSSVDLRCLWSWKNTSVNMIQHMESRLIIPTPQNPISWPLCLQMCIKNGPQKVLEIWPILRFPQQMKNGWIPGPRQPDSVRHHGGKGKQWTISRGWDLEFGIHQHFWGQRCVLNFVADVASGVWALNGCESWIAAGSVALLSSKNMMKHIVS